MQLSTFVSVGENIHCTRSFKVGGVHVKDAGDGNFVVAYQGKEGPKQLPVPDLFKQGADWQAEKVKHCAVAIQQGVYGDEAGKAAGVDYLQTLAAKQEQAGATYLDLNVDEFSTDVGERIKLMKWTVDVAQKAASIPMSIDSSNLDILRAGLEACDQGRGRPMVNSVSLERADAVEVAAEHKAVVIASAAGEKGLPTTLPDRMENIGRIVGILTDKGFALGDIHLDPLVFPISTDGNNGKGFLDCVKTVREKYGPEIHIVAGLSNISFGMPNRKLINQVFTWLVCEAGGDGGIVDPMQINVEILNALDPQSEPFKLARALLMGEDEFGMEFIMASREGTI